MSHCQLHIVSVPAVERRGVRRGMNHHRRRWQWHVAVLVKMLLHCLRKKMGLMLRKVPHDSRPSRCLVLARSARQPRVRSQSSS